MLIVSLTHPTLIRVRYCSPRSQLGLIGIHKHNHVVIGLHTFPQEQTSVCGRYQPFDGYIVAFIHLRVGKGDVVSHDLLDSRLHISHNSPQSCQCLVIVPSAQVPTQRDCSFTIKKKTWSVSSCCITPDTIYRCEFDLASIDDCQEMRLYVILGRSCACNPFFRVFFPFCS